MIKPQTTLKADWTERPHFQEKEELTAERLNRIHEHHAARLRHAVLGLAGPGVVYGYAIERDDKCVCKIMGGRLHVSCGLAFDRHGRQLHYPGGWVGIDDLAGRKPSRDDDARWHDCCDDHEAAQEAPPDPRATTQTEIPPPQGDEAPPRHCGRPYTLWVHYAERRRGGDERCGCPGDDTDWIQECVVFSLTPCCKRHSCDCPDHCHHCVSTCDYVCGRLGADDVVIPPDEHLRGLCEEPGRLCPVGCDDLMYDPDAGIPLACVMVCERDPHDECGPEMIFCPEEPCVCAHRPYVYRNPLLFELIQGCHLDLPYVASLSFEPWLASDFVDPVPWDIFAGSVPQGLAVMFSHPIRKSTLHVASVYVGAIVGELESEFRDVLRFPVERIEYLDERHPPNPPRILPADAPYAHGVRLRFPEHWVRRQFHERHSRFEDGAIIEFTVRGAMLRDQCDRLLDARPLAYPKAKSGSSMMGDDFVAAFCVAAKPREPYKAGDEALPAEALRQSF